MTLIEKLIEIFQKKFSLKEILSFSLLAGALSWLCVTLNSMNAQLKLHADALAALQISNNELNKILDAKNTQLEIVQQKVNILQSQNDSLKNLIDEKTLKNATATWEPNTLDILTAQNEMTQFWVKVGGVVLCGCIVLYTGYYVFSFISPFFTWTTQAKNFLQTHTPLFQDKQTYSYKDTHTDTDWIVNIINKQLQGIQIKPFSSNTYINLSDYLTKLSSDAGVMTSSITPPPHTASAIVDAANTLSAASAPAVLAAGSSAAANTAAVVSSSVVTNPAAVVSAPAAANTLSAVSAPAAATAAAAASSSTVASTADSVAILADKLTGLL